MPRDLRSPVWVCYFHEVGLSREHWIVQDQRKSVEKKTSPCPLKLDNARSVFTFERLSEDTLFCLYEDVGVFQ